MSILIILQRHILYPFMNVLRKILAGLALCVLFVQCATVPPAQPTVVTPKKNTRLPSSLNVATFEKEGFANIFVPNLLDASGRPFWAEASAVLFDGNKILVATDKDMPNEMTSVFYWKSEKELNDGVQAANVYDRVYKNSTKYEDFAITPDGSISFLMTGFDRVKNQDHEWDGYNTIYYWETGKEYSPQVLTFQPGALNSVSMRETLAKVIGSTNTNFPKGVPYYKIEGLAADETQLYFGVREEGRQFDDFEYKIKIIAVPYYVRNISGTKRVEFSGEFKVLADFKPNPAELGLLGPLGLSSIEYDRFNKRFMILTTYELKERIGAYLWTASESDIAKNQPFTLVKDIDGKPFAFTHKAEDITMLDAERALVICDDDRYPTVVKGKIRATNQSAFAIIKFK